MHAKHLFILLPSIVLSTLTLLPASFSTKRVYATAFDASYELGVASCFSPVLYQKWVDIRDNFTCFDFDGDWNPLNNWENTSWSPLPPYVYFSIFETKSHYIAMYFLFYPRNQHDIPVFSNYHENDVEGLCIFGGKGNNASNNGLHLVLCQFHTTLGWYSNVSMSSPCSGLVHSPAVTTGENGSHPVVIIESGGHGIYMLENDTRDFDGIIFKNASIGPLPSNSSGFANYSLIPLYSSLWMNRHEIEAHGNATDNWFYGGVHEFFITIPGDNYGPFAAKYPWSWSFHEECGLGRGDWFFNPAKFLKKVTNNATVSCEYLYNPYFLEMGMDFNQEEKLLSAMDFRILAIWIFVMIISIASWVIRHHLTFTKGGGPGARV